MVSVHDTSDRLIAVDTRTTGVSDVKRVMGWANLHGPNQVGNPQTEDRAVLGFIEAGPAGGHGNQKTIQVVQKGDLLQGPRLL